MGHLYKKAALMFIKKSSKVDPKSRKSYTAYYLIESVRTNKGPRQKILLYMGSEINLPEEEHKILAQRIEEIISGQQSIISYPDSIERLAQMYASHVIQRLSEVLPETKTPSIEAQEADFLTINVNTIEKSEPRSVGIEHLLLT
jgi:hypothetical protein